MQELVPTLAIRNMSAGKDRTAVLDGSAILTTAFNEEIAKEQTKLDNQRKADLLAHQTTLAGYSIAQLGTEFNNNAAAAEKLKGINGIKSVEIGVIGDGFTLHFGDGKEIEIDPDDKDDLAILKKLLEVKEEVPVIPEAQDWNA